MGKINVYDKIVIKKESIKIEEIYT